MSKKPNIILINCDDLGYGDLGCYGSPANATPALDQMAAEGLLLTDFYMASAVCSPSRGAMMTGCYPPRIGFGAFGEDDNGAWVLFPGMDRGLNPDEVCIAKLLKQAGYATRIVGKWHCGDQPEFLPTRHGFDGYFGIPFSNDMGRQLNHPKQWPPLPLLRDEEVIQEQPDQAAITERYVEDAMRFVREHREQPFFLYFAHMYVHLPHYPPARFLKTSRNGPYGGCVAAIDWSVGVLMDEIRRLGLEDDTLFVFTSDNGARGDWGGSNGALRGNKGSTWEGGFRVPCIMRWKGVLPEGKTCQGLAGSIDLYPTFARMAGISPPADRTLDGVDLTPMLEDPAAVSPRECFFYYFRNDLSAVRKGDWKLHVRRRDEEVLELYHLRDDVGETNNLAGERPEVVADLQSELARCREDLGDRAAGVKGKGRRPVGRVEHAKPLTEYREDCPYFYAEYDLADRG